MQKKKVLILGGTQFVGRQVVEKLMNDDSYDLYLFNRGRSNPRLFPTVKRIIGDRESDDIAKIAAHKWDYIVDFTLFSPSTLAKTLEYENKDVTKYIFISTISVFDLKEYDGQNQLLETDKLESCTEEEKADRTMRTYGKRKAECERMLNETELNVITLRPSLIYGKYDFTDRFYYWLYRAKNRHEAIMPSMGNEKMSLTYAADFAEMIIACLADKVPNGTYNCSTHEPLSLREMLDIMKPHVQSFCNFYPMSAEDLAEAGVRMQRDLPLWFGTNLMVSKQKIEKTGFQCKTFEQSIIETTAYFEEIHWPMPRIGLSKKIEMQIIKRNKYK